jgi:hypothetical protein
MARPLAQQSRKSGGQRQVDGDGQRPNATQVEPPELICDLGVAANSHERIRSELKQRERRSKSSDAIRARKMGLGRKKDAKQPGPFERKLRG